MTIMTDMLYKVDFFIAVFGIVAEVVLSIITPYFIFKIIPDGKIAGVSFEYFILVQTLAFFVYSIGSMLINNNAWNMRERIYNGKFDYDLLKPGNLLFIALIKRVGIIGEIPAFISYLIVLGWIFIFGNLSFWWWQWVLGLVIFINSLLIICVLFVIAGISEFYLRNNKNVFYVLNDLIETNVYPKNIYPKQLQWFLLFVVPILMIVNPIYGVLEKNYSWVNFGQMLGVDVFVLLVAYFLWKDGLRRYQSVA